MKFIYNIHGDYPLDHLKESLRCLRRFIPGVHTELWTDRPREKGLRVDSVVQYSEYQGEKGVAVSDKVRVDALLAQNEICCYIDSDIYPVSKNFIAGFNIVEHMGLAFAANPRAFICSAHGTGDGDVSIEGLDVPRLDYWTSINLGLIFYNPAHEKSRSFLNTLKKTQGKHGPRAAFILATLAEQWHPYILAQQFCADAIYQDMLAMHVGGKYHAHMLEHYNSYHRA